VLAPTVPFLYQASPCPFYEEVDFFDFLIDTEKNEKREPVPDGGLSTDNNATMVLPGGTGTDNGV